MLNICSSKRGRRDFLKLYGNLSGRFDIMRSQLLLPAAAEAAQTHTFTPWVQTLNTHTRAHTHLLYQTMNSAVTQWHHWAEDSHKIDHSQLRSAVSSSNETKMSNEIKKWDWSWLDPENRLIKAHCPNASAAVSICPLLLSERNRHPLNTVNSAQLLTHHHTPSLSSVHDCTSFFLWASVCVWKQKQTDSDCWTCVDAGGVLYVKIGQVLYVCVNHRYVTYVEHTLE